MTSVTFFVTLSTLTGLQHLRAINVIQQEIIEKKMDFF